MADIRRPSSPEVTTALEQLGRLSLRDLSMDDLLQSVSQLSSSVLPGQPETSVTVLVRNKPHTVASSGEMANRLDERQYELGDGPCLHTARSLEITEIPDTRIEQRWPDYVQRAVERGCLSSFSVPLAIDQDTQITGAMNVYAREGNAFDQSSREAALAFGSYAEVAASNLHAYRSAQDTADNLRVALESRAVIDQAKGILMERHKLTADQAFQLLVEVSSRTNVKLRGIAEELVRTGELPRARRRT